MKTNILVVTKTYSTTLGIVRSLGSAGYTIDLMYIESTKGVSKIVSSSKYVNRTIVIKGRDDEEIISRIIKEYSNKEEKYYIFPTDDYAASLIDRNTDKLKGFLFPYAGNKRQGEITRLMDKSIQTSIAERSGFLVAKQWIVSLNQLFDHVDDDITYPCFVKPLISAQGYKKEIGVCRDRRELIEKLKSLKEAKPDRSVLLQEYLDISQEYSMSGVCLDQEIILPAIVKKLRVAEKEKGVTLFGKLVDTSEIKETVEPLYSTLRDLHYIGMFDMEVLQANGKIYFGEINLRSGGPNYAYCAAGVNLPKMLMEYISGETVDRSCQIQLHKTFLYEKAAWEDYKKGLMTKSELDELYKEADILLLDQNDDPLPGQEFLKFITSKKKGNLKSIILSFVNRMRK